MVAVVPMIHVRVLESPFDVSRSSSFRDLPAGMTAAQLVEDLRPRSWGTMPIAVSVDGRRLDAREVACEIPDGSWVTIGPSPDGLEWLLYAVASLVLSTLVTWAYSKLVGVPEPEPQDRGDDSSPTYAWDRIATEYRSGLPIPLIFGRMAVGGTAIYTSVRVVAATANLSARERLAIILAVGEGRIRAIGGVDGGDRGESDGMGGFPGDDVADAGPQIPAGIEINGTALDHQTIQPGARVSVRMGEPDQSPFPQREFAGVAQTEVVNLDLDDAGRVATYTIEDSDPKTRLEVLIAFPGGLYGTDSNGNLTRINAGLAGSSQGQQGCAFFLDWRPAGRNLAWVTIGTIVVDVPPTVAAFTHTVGIDLVPNNQPPTAASIEVRVRRLTPDRRASNEVSAAVWRQIVSRSEATFSYPEVALLGLEIQAGDQITGGRPNFLIPVDGLLVRVWDATIHAGAPSAAEYWDVPAGGDDYAGIWSHPPGRNPAWVLAAFLTHPKGLGRFFSTDSIDWPAFRNWADFCDRSVDHGAGTEAAFQCDISIDSPEPAWRTVLAICQSGRAAPILVGGRMSVRYQFADAHGRGTNAIGAKTRAHLITTTQAEDFSVRYLNPNARPSSIVFDILDAENGYTHASVLVPDPESGLDDPASWHATRETRETRELRGVTRRSQAIREGLFAHAANRLIASEVSLVAGPEALSADIGDVVGVQHDVFRPFGERSFAARVASETADPDSDELILDRDVTIPSGAYVATRLQDGSIAEVAVASAAGEYVEGDTITLASSIALRRGAPVAIGKAAKLVRDYEIVGTTIGLDMKRRLRMVEWHPEIHDDVDAAPYLDVSTFAQSLGGDFDLGQTTEPAQVDAATIRVAAIGRDGLHRIAWEPAPGYSDAKARVFVRPAGGARWWLIDETGAGSARFGLAAGESYDVAVAVANRLGAFPSPDSAPRTTVIGEEFAPLPPRDIVGARATISDGWTVDLAWEPHGGRTQVRRGPEFLGAEIVAETSASSIRVDRVVPYQDGDAVRFWLAIVAPSGLLSGSPASVDVETSPPSSVVELDRTAFDPDDGTADGVEVSGTVDFELALSAGYLRGEWTTEVLDLGYDVRQTIALAFEFGWSEDLTIADAEAIPIGSGEGHARRIAGRESTPARPGLVESVRIADAEIWPLGQPEPQDIAATVGARALAVVWFRAARVAETISALPWIRYSGPVDVVASKLQVRVEILRHDHEAEPFFRYLAARRFTR